MTTKPTTPKQNSLYLPIKQVYFDQILNGTKDKEYRAISPNTVRKYIENEKVDGELQLFYDPDLISEEKLELYANDEMYFNDGVFPYIPKGYMVFGLSCRERQRKGYDDCGGNGH